MIFKVAIENFKRFRERSEFLLKPEGMTFLAGGNNSGKSTLLQALAVWEFARSVIQINKGKIALCAGNAGQGVGVGAEEFSPIALPDLKHLWSDLSVFRNYRGDRYTLRIRCDWMAGSTSRHLEFGLALLNDRLFLKRTSSDLEMVDHVPRLAYLPPFAGIGPREERLSPAARKRWIGRGLAGAVLRNLLYDFWEQNYAEREKLKNPKGRVPGTLLAHLRRTDSWEQLASVLEEVFKTGLSVRKFDDLFHTTIEVTAWEGHLANKQFRKKASAPEKDLMVEGSGFLQWLSVYALALNRDLDVLLLDEPDAHLHPALQGYLIQKLGQLARENSKQVLLATHSTTILSEVMIDRIFRMEDRTYLRDEGGRVSLFLGLGSQYAPRFDQLKRVKRLFLHDGPVDLEVIQVWARTLGYQWPSNLVSWMYTKEEGMRSVLFDELLAEIPELKAISLQDRDDYKPSEVRRDLTFGSAKPSRRGLDLRRWRRRNIENYLLHPGAIARAAQRSEAEVRALLGEEHGLSIGAGFIDSDCPEALIWTDGKKVIAKSPRSVKEVFGVDQRQIAGAMTSEEIPEDAKLFLRTLMEFSRA